MSMQEIVDKIRSFDRFVVGANTRLDGDAVGSQIAVYHLLKQMGKNVELANLEVIPAHYQFLAGAELAHSNYNKVSPDQQCFITVDAPDVTREDLLDGHFPQDIFILNIDHHGSNYMYGDVNWIDAKAASVGEMLVDLIATMGQTLTVEMATAIYVSIVTDTGRFGFDCTTARTHRAAVALHEAGIDLQEITRQLYQSVSLGELKLQACAGNALEIHCDGKLSIMTLTADDFVACGFEPEESQGFVSMALNVKGVVMAIYQRTSKTGRSKFSFRSKSDLIDVNKFASQFGGGGHSKAAGLVLDGGFDQDRVTIQAAAEAFVTEALQA